MGITIRNFCIFIALMASSIGNCQELRFAYTQPYSQDPLVEECKNDVDNVLSIIQHHAVYLEMPFKRAVVQANRGDVDGVILRSESIESAYPNLIPLPSPCAELKLHLIGKQGRAFTFSDWQDIPPDYVFGHLDGVAVFKEEVLSKNKELKFISVSNRLQLEEMFIRDRVDLIFIRTDRFEQLTQKGHGDIIIVKENIFTLELFAFLNYKHHAIIQHLQQHSMPSEQH